MFYPKELVCLEVERGAIGGLIRNPEVFYEIDAVCNELDFSHSTFKTLYSIIKNCLSKGEKIDKILISEKAKNLGIKFKDDFNLLDFIESLSFTPYTAQQTIKYFQELSRYRIRRDIFDIGKNLQETMKVGEYNSYTDIISRADSIYNQTIKNYSDVDAPLNIFDDLYEMVEERGNNPVEDYGYKTPFDNFNRLYGGLRPKNLYAFAARAGQGKALEENELIPTPKGFVKIKDLNVGDEVFAVDGTPTKVLAKANWTDRELYKVTTSDGFNVLVDSQHDWTVQRRSDYDWEVRNTEFLASSTLRDRCKIPLHKAVKYNKKDLPIDPYCLGLWLGDGHSDRLALTSADDFIVQKWKEFGEKYELEMAPHGPYCYKLKNLKPNKIKTNKLRPLFDSFNLIENKHIPEIYMQGSIHQRKELLRGLIDTDGHVCSDGRTEFVSVKKEFAYQVLELIHSLGVKASISEGDAKIYGRVVSKRYRIMFYMKNCAKLPRKNINTADGKKYPHRYLEFEKAGKGNTVCIQIEHPSHLYLCTRAYIPTHNSSLLSATALGCHLINPKIKVLYLDTEMSLIEQQTRMASNLSGVPLWYIETGNYRKNQEYLNKVRNALSTVKKYQYYHYQVANKNIDEICSIIRRWFFSKVGRGNPALVVFDYVKLGSSEKIGQNWAEHQQIGTMVDKLKRISEEIDAPLLTAIQLNRGGEAAGKVAIDDSSSFALSDRLQWFASFTGIFRAKTADELSADGADFGTHKLIKTKSRWQGKEARGFNDFIKRKMPDGSERYIANYINFDITNFRITEKGTLQDVIDRQNNEYDLKDDPNPNEKLLD